MLFLDGVYVDSAGSSTRFRWVKAPPSSELNQLALESADEAPMDQLRGHSITYRIAVGPQQGRKVFTLQTLPDERDAAELLATTAGNVAGFSLHAGVAAKANQRVNVSQDQTTSHMA